MADHITVNIFVSSLEEIMPVPLKDWAVKVGKKPSTLRALCESGNLPGAEKRGGAWFVNPLVHALSSVSSGVNSAPRGTEGERRGDVRKPGGRKREAGPEGGSGAGPSGRSKIDV